MSNSTWGELVSSMPDDGGETEGLGDVSPERAYERLLQSLNNLVIALKERTPAEGVVELLEQCVDCLMVTCEAADGTLFVLDEHTRELNFVIVKGEVPADKLKWRKLARGYGIAGWVAENAQHVVANEIEYDSRFCSWFDDEFAYKTKTVLAVPIMYEDRVLGVIELLNKRGNRGLGLFTNADVAATSVFANLSGQVLEDLTSRGEKTHA